MILHIHQQQSCWCMCRIIRWYMSCFGINTYFCKLWRKNCSNLVARYIWKVLEIEKQEKRNDVDIMLCHTLLDGPMKCNFIKKDIILTLYLRIIRKMILFFSRLWYMEVKSLINIYRDGHVNDGFKVFCGYFISEACVYLGETYPMLRWMEAVVIIRHSASFRSLFAGLACFLCWKLLILSPRMS